MSDRFIHNAKESNNHITENIGSTALEEICILVVDDDKEICGLIYDLLNREGYTVHCAYDGVSAAKLLNLNNYHLAVLDKMLPGIDGYELLKRIRQKDFMPVVIISAKGEEYDKVIGLGLGADDYISKPFKNNEMLARLKSLLRRYLYYRNDSGKNQLLLKHMDIVMDIDKHEVIIGDRTVLLTAKEFDILKLFMGNPKKVFTKNQIFDLIWNEDYFGNENTLMVHISRLRDKIEKDPAHPIYIQTVWGIGYKLNEG
jgi:DNA-binding response OmpR family regulator